MQVVTYTLAKPAREALFAPLPPAEKLNAKLAIDSLVLRLGDAGAAGAFQLLSGRGGAGGPPALAGCRAPASALLLGPVTEG